MGNDNRTKPNIVFFPPLSGKLDFCATFEEIAKKNEQHDAEEARSAFRMPILSSIFSHRTSPNDAPSASAPESEKGPSII